MATGTLAWPKSGLLVNSVCTRRGHAPFCRTFAVCGLWSFSRLGKVFAKGSSGRKRHTGSVEMARNMWCGMFNLQKHCCDGTSDAGWLSCISLVHYRNATYV